jgi:hypothetical protein
MQDKYKNDYIRTIKQKEVQALLVPTKLSMMVLMLSMKWNPVAS